MQKRQDLQEAWPQPQKDVGWAWLGMYAWTVLVTLIAAELWVKPRQA